MKRISSSINQSLTEIKERENLEEDDGDENQVQQISDFEVHIRENKHFRTVSQQSSSRMAMVIKIGTGGDQQSHVQSPRSIRSGAPDRDSERMSTKSPGNLSILKNFGTNPYNNLP